jgi:ABC-2 type transport system ATP-binding protein
MDNHHLITTHDVHRRYGGDRGFDAVRGVSLSVRKGELFALLGTNGAGKTSLLEVLEGLAPTTSGTVRVLGQDPYRSRRQVRPRIGIMLQEGGFPADLTVTETARMWAGTLTRPRPVAEALELVDLQHRSQVTVKQLSGGERRRLDLAVALLGRPEVLFLDEPTTGIDPQSRRRVWQLVRNLLQAGTTIVMTTHYLQEVEELADRLAIMHAGAIVRTGTPAEVAATQPARITFKLPATAPPLPVLPGAIPTADPMRAAGDVVIHSQDLQATLAAVLAWAAGQRIDLTDLDARPGSLEEAFLAADPSSAVPRNDSDQEIAA